MNNQCYKSDIGMDFQSACRSHEWKSSLIVFEKYKRKYNLEFEDLTKIRNYMVDYATERETKGKKINKDILTQEASSFIKKQYGSQPN